MAGFGDTVTHQVKADLVMGFEGLDLDLLTGFRLKLEIGYDSTIHDRFYQIPGHVDEGFMGRAGLQQRTPLGSFRSWYKHTPAANTFYAGFKKGGLEFYYKDVDSNQGSDDRMVGLTMTFDLFSSVPAVRREEAPLFAPRSSGYGEPSQIRHARSDSSETFAVAPTIETGYMR